MVFSLFAQYRLFFERNLFERIIIYLFVSELVVKIVFELGLGQWWFEQSQHKQWLFYGLLALDYLISFRRVMNLRVSINVMSLFSLFLFVLIAHGLCVGILNHNRPFEIVNDTIPLLMIALNVLRFQSYEEMRRPIDFKFLLYVCTSLVFATCLIGQFALMIGRPSVANIAQGPVFYPLFLAGLVMVRPFPKILIVMAAILFVLALPGMNRTTLAFIGIVMGGIAVAETLKNPSRGAFLILGFVLISGVGWIILPENSPIHQRLVSLANIDFSKRTGSVGERQEEFDSIKETLAFHGQTTQLTGLGFGGLYEARFTHKYIKNYGHAHYSWAWFNLRFGTLGYIYLCIFMSVLIFNVLKGFTVGHSLGRFEAFLCLFGILYCFTYVNAVFMASGLHFLHLKREEDLT